MPRSTRLWLRLISLAVSPFVVQAEKKAFLQLLSVLLPGRSGHGVSVVHFRRYRLQERPEQPSDRVLSQEGKALSDDLKLNRFNISQV